MIAYFHEFRFQANGSAELVWKGGDSSRQHYSCETSGQQAHNELLSPSDSQLQQQMLGEVRAGRVAEAELSFTTTRGQSVWFRVVKTPLWNEDHTIVTGFFAAAEEITLQKQAEVDRQASEARYRMVFDNSADAIVLFDNQGRYVQVNDAACQMLGYSREQLLGMRVTDVLDEHVPTHIQPYLQHPQQRHERGVYRYAATMREFEYSVCRIGPNLHQSIFHDVTERKQLESQLQQQASALAMLRERERLSHDLQIEVDQSLGALAHQIEVLRTLLTESRPVRAAATLNSLAAMVQAMQHDVRDLTNETESWPANVVAEQPPFTAFYHLVQRLRAFHNFKVTITVPEGLTREELPAHCEVAILRIAKEALENVRLHAGVNQARVLVACEQGQLVLSVQDTGSGFVQADVGAALSTIGSERGFGLRSMQVHAEEAGGELHIRTKLGAGTLVQVRVPLHPQQLAHQSLRVLLADTSPAFLQVLAQLLRSHNIDIVGTTSNSSDTIAQVQALRPNVVVMDLHLSEYTGLQTTRAILAEQPDCRVLLLDTIEHEASMLLALRAGARGYLPRSIQGKELVRLVTQAHASDEPLLTTTMAARVLRQLLHRYTTTSTATAALSQLNERQREVLRRSSQGDTYKMIGQQLGYSTRTIKYIMAEVVRLLQVQTRQEAELLFRQQRLSYEPAVL